MWVGEAIAGDIGKARCLRRIDSGTARIVIPGSQPATRLDTDAINRSGGRSPLMATWQTKLCGSIGWILIGGIYENDR
jgi:hypothetical protein